MDTEPIQGCQHPRVKHHHGRSREDSRCCSQANGGHACEGCRRVNARYYKIHRLNQHRKVQRHVPAVGPRRRVQAMFALGWSGPEMARAGGGSQSAIVALVERPDQETVHVDVAAAISRAYRALAVRKPPEPDQWTTTVRTRARRWAAREGWPSPAAWDDDIDDPAAEPHGTSVGRVQICPICEKSFEAARTTAVYCSHRCRNRKGNPYRDPEGDAVIVERFVAGELSPGALSRAQRAKVVAYMAERGRSDTQIADRLQIATRSVYRIRAQHDIPSGYRKAAAA